MSSSNSTITALTILAIAVGGRILMEPFPSVEPILPLAVAAGILCGSELGLTVGALSYAFSNIFMLGGLGLWTVFQALGGAVAGVLGGMKFKQKLSQDSFIILAVAATLAFEFFMNIGFGSLMVFPFSYVHLISNVVFAVIIFSFLPKPKEEQLKENSEPKKEEAEEKAAANEENGEKK